MIKQIKNHPDYWIDIAGQVYRRAIRNGEIYYHPLKWDISNGYARVKLDNDNEYIGRLVLQAFKPTKDTSLRAFYIDGNTLNNSVANLVWLAPSEILLYSQYTIRERLSIFRENERRVVIDED